VSQLIALSFLLLGIFLISVFWKYKKMVVVGLCIIFLVVGIWRHQAVLSNIEDSKIKEFIGKEIVLVGFIDKEPSKREKSTKLEIKTKQILTESNSLSLEEKVLVTTWQYPEYEYGDSVKIKGKLEEAEIFEGFNYRDYLAKDGIFAVMYFPKIELVDKNQGNFLQNLLISFKNKLEESLNKILPRPHSAILEALLFGKEENISGELKDKLNLTGTRHITAVSGMNLTIISVLLLNFLLGLGFWRQQAFYFSVIFIIFYILMVGAPSSVIRAGVMVILFLIAQHLGRVSASPRAIVFAATFMLIQNPLLLRLDVGFQLSFLATMGLIYLQPAFSEWLKKIPNNFQLRNNLSATLAAQAFTLPILVYNFGRIPIISPIANILILPLIPFVTILGFIVALIGIFWQGLAQILSWPIWLLITYNLKVIDFSSNIPWASLVFENAHWILVVVSYLILGAFIFWLERKRKLKFLNY
jgi:competence protein ComEC